MKKYKDMEEITGYFVDIPEGGQIMSKVNNDVVDQSIADYASENGCTYLPETSTEYGLVEWVGDEPQIYSVKIDNQPVDVQPVINGAHPVRKPKPL